jgi:hypothetical protein
MTESGFPDGDHVMHDGADARNEYDGVASSETTNRLDLVEFDLDYETLESTTAGHNLQKYVIEATDGDLTYEITVTESTFIRDGEFESGSTIRATPSESDNGAVYRAYSGSSAQKMLGDEELSGEVLERAY